MAGLRECFIAGVEETRTKQYYLAEGAKSTLSLSRLATVLLRLMLRESVITRGLPGMQAVALRLLPQGIREAVTALLTEYMEDADWLNPEGFIRFRLRNEQVRLDAFLLRILYGTGATQSKHCPHSASPKRPEE